MVVGRWLIPEFLIKAIIYILESYRKSQANQDIKSSILIAS